MTSDCPTPEMLARIGIEAGAGSCPADVADHIASCQRCQLFLERRVEGGFDSFMPTAARLPVHAAPLQIGGFTIEKELGRGAMGIVYLARRDAPKRPVALKILPGGRCAGPRERRQWMREAEAASQVRHPNVVTLYEVGEVDDWFLLALEYVPGGTLTDRLAAPLAPADAAQLLEKIARAVHHIHKCGQLHLDLKPSNILLDGDAGAGAGWQAVVPKVSDFGVARPTDSTATETIGIGAGGTPSYMAPEQITARRDELSASADVYGLGAILYHTLTGRPPFCGATVLETIDLVRRQQPVPPRRLNPNIPRDLETICLKCLQKDPGRRYQSAGDFANDLRNWLDGGAISARPVSVSEKSWLWCRRRPVVAALSSALVLAIVAGFSGVIVLWRRAEANLQLSTELLDDLVELSVGGQGNLPKVLTRDERIVSLKRTRGRLLNLGARRLGQVQLAHRLAMVERRLGHDLLDARRYPDANLVAGESLARLEALVRQNPTDVKLINDERECLSLIGSVVEELGNSQDAIFYLTRTVESSNHLMRLAPAPERVLNLFYARRDLALFLYAHGDQKRATALADCNVRLLDDLPPAGDGRGAIVARILAHVDYGLFAPGSCTATPSGTGLCESCDLGPLPAPGAPADRRQSSHDWARAATLVLRSHDPAASADVEALEALEVMERLGMLASLMRRHQKPEAAHWIAERIRAWADQVIAAYPDQSASYLALCAALAQSVKDAWQTDDRAAVVTSLKSGLEAARKAAMLDPKSVRAQHAIDHFQRRLDGFYAMR